MITIDVKINNVPTDLISIVNTAQTNTSDATKYTITHHDFLSQTCKKKECFHHREKGRFNLIKLAAKELQNERSD